MLSIVSTVVSRIVCLFEIFPPLTSFHSNNFEYYVIFIMNFLKFTEKINFLICQSFLFFSVWNWFWGTEKKGNKYYVIFEIQNSNWHIRKSTHVLQRTLHKFTLKKTIVVVNIFSRNTVIKPLLLHILLSKFFNTNLFNLNCIKLLLCCKLFKFRW